MDKLNVSIPWPDWYAAKFIGSGSFGSVYEIRRDVFGQTERAAMKLITLPTSSSDINELYDSGMDAENVSAFYKNSLKNIVNEYTLMRKMNGSANIVNCDDYFCQPHDDGIGWDIYIKMELLTPLVQLVDVQIPDSQVIKIAKDLCRALMLCRKHDIIHRDIKPQNIFVSDNGDYKLGDFGIAKTIEKTSLGTKIGTYKYMAPEVYHSQEYSYGADIYSLGMVLYWLLNEHRSPFVPLPPAQISMEAEENSRQLRFSGKELPEPAHGSPELRRIVLKACEFDPSSRYSEAGEMLLDLRKLSPESFNDTAVISGSGSSAAFLQSTDKAPESDTLISEEKTVRAFSNESKPRKKNHAPSVIAAVIILAAGIGIFAFRSSAEPEPLPSATAPAREIGRVQAWDSPASTASPAPTPELSWQYQEAEGQTYCYEENGEPLSGFQFIDNSTFYFDDEGRMLTGWQTVENDRYYFEQAGYMVTEWYELDGSLFYFGKDGAMRTGWQDIDGSRYYFEQAGYMVTEWYEISGYMYYFGKDGAMCTGWQNIDGEDYFFLPEGPLFKEASSVLADARP